MTFDAACRACRRLFSSKRLKELEDGGIIRRVASPVEPGVLEYHLTRSGKELGSVVESVGVWGQRWVQSSLSLKHLDPSLLMWDMRRNLDPTPMTKHRCVIQFLYPDQPPALRHFWLVVAPGAEVDLCSVDPGFEVDLYVTTDLRTMTAIWMGLSTVREAIAAKNMTLTGDRQLAAHMQTWLGLSHFAVEKKLVTG